MDFSVPSITTPIVRGLIKATVLSSFGCPGLCLQKISGGKKKQWEKEMLIGVKLFHIERIPNFGGSELRTADCTTQSGFVATCCRFIF